MLGFPGRDGQLHGSGNPVHGHCPDEHHPAFVLPHPGGSEVDVRKLTTSNSPGPLTSLSRFALSDVKLAASMLAVTWQSASDWPISSYPDAMLNFARTLPRPNMCRLVYVMAELTPSMRYVPALGMARTFVSDWLVKAVFLWTLPDSPTPGNC